MQVLLITVAVVILNYCSARVFQLQTVCCGPKDTGQVAVNGGDSRCATGPFTWDWGDGDVEDGWFPMQHIYADKERNYAVTVTAHYCDGTSDRTKAAIYFTVHPFCQSGCRIDGCANTVY